MRVGRGGSRATGGRRSSAVLNRQLRDGRRGLISITDFFCTVFAQPFFLVLFFAEAFAVVALGLEQLDEVRLAVPAPRV